jgi:hypothetical protein
VPRPAQAGRTVRSLLGALVATVALLVGAAPAMADSASISVAATNGQPDPVAYISRVFTVSGTATAGTRLYVKHRLAGGTGCAPSAFADSGSWPDASFYGAAVNGSFSFQRLLAWGRPGTWMFCFWLAGDETTVTTPIMQTVTFREPAGTIGAAVYPAVPRPGQPAQITVAGTTESSRRVYAKIRPADGTPCATSYDADAGGGFVGGWSVDGPFSIDANVTQAYPGAYLICLWLAGSSDDVLPIGGVRQQTYAVVRPRQPQVASIAILDCRTAKHVTRVRARTTRSVCLRYRFSTPPAAGLLVSVAYVTPRHAIYKTVSTTWPSGASTAMTSRALPSRAYLHRHGTWFAVLRVDGAWVRTKSVHVI